MVDLPRGTVSLLFTDIEGSTQLQHRLHDRYREVVTEHRRLLEEAIESNGGQIVDRQTESFFAVFTRMRDAAGAASDAQRVFAAYDWPEGAQVKVRMGLHAGEPELDGDRYVGLAVARAARISACAYGGQVLLSSAARGLLSDGRFPVRALGSSVTPSSPGSSSSTGSPIASRVRGPGPSPDARAAARWFSPEPRSPWSRSPSLPPRC